MKADATTPTPQGSDDATDQPSIFRRWLDAFHRYCYVKWNRHQYLECHKTASRICAMGFDNPPEIQELLSAAKDYLYGAAVCFKAEERKAIQGAQPVVSMQPVAKRQPKSLLPLPLTRSKKRR